MGETRHGHRPARAHDSLFLAKELLAELLEQHHDLRVLRVRVLRLHERELVDPVCRLDLFLNRLKTVAYLLLGHLLDLRLRLADAEEGLLLALGCVLRTGV